MHPVHFLSLERWNQDMLLEVLGRATVLKPERRLRILEGRTLLMLFEKPSTRTRVSFEVAMGQLGGRTIYMDSQNSQISRGESFRDTAEVLSRYVDVISARVNSHKTLEELSEFSQIPVINALSDLFHPCQALADVMTMREHGGEGRLKVAFVGDGHNNVTHSLILACSLLGYEMMVASPYDSAPNSMVVKRALENHKKYGGDLEIVEDPEEAVENADAVYTDTWMSMGIPESEKRERLEKFASYRVDANLMAKARPDAVFMHCLPAHVGEEVTPEVIYGRWSVVYDQAENRLHTQKSLISWLLGVEM
ncbi:MAG TPA: ornithine carbamoyltransferase [archaeon]|nr:ornithine carbamoyltransferase [archaeon]